MKTDKPLKRMTLRELLSQAEKSTQELGEQIRADLKNYTADLTNLSRPVRRRSSYPTLIALNNALDRCVEANDEISQRGAELIEQLKIIRARVRREMRRDAMVEYESEAA